MVSESKSDLNVTHKSQGHWCWHCSSETYDFLLTFHGNCVSFSRIVSEILLLTFKSSDAFSGTTDHPEDRKTTQNL